MLNPFIQMPPDKRHIPDLHDEETYAQLRGYNLDSAFPRPTVGLLLGRLLIKMGQKLSKQDVSLRSTRENA